MKKINKYRIILFLIVLIISSITIGYSAFGSNLLIGDISLNVEINSDIRVTNFNINSVSSEVVSKYESYNVRSVNSNVILPYEDSYITYKIEVTNFGNLGMGILAINGLPSNLEYELDGYELKDKICDDSNNCTLGISREFYITIRYKEYDSSNINYDLKLEFDFRSFYSVSYQNLENNGYPVELMETSSLDVIFSSLINTNIIVTMDNVILGSDEYSFLNKKILNVPSVTGDIVISKIPNFGETIKLNNTLSNDCPSLNGNYAIVDSIATTFSYCSIPDIYGTSYYFRGTPINNYVKFANFYWRVIRVNGDDTVRLIYAGTTPLDNGYDDSNTLYTRIGQGYFNSSSRNNSTLGYMFGSSTTTYDLTHTNTNSSVIKNSLDEWYVSEGFSNYSNYLADSYFCNDRSLYKSEYSTKFSISKVTSTDNIGGLGTNNADTVSGAGSNKTYYGAFYRFVKSSDGKEYPTLMCNKNDAFTVDDTVNGNGALDYPIATITGDEIVLAGGIYHNDTANKSFYLYTGYRYWTMTPSFLLGYSGGFNLFSTGWMTGAGVISSNMGYRPVINISASTYVIDGNGTKDDPYILYND